MSDRPAGAGPSRLVAVLGPTNTGKTHLAVERMLGHASGMIGLPLRLLAREIYDRIVKLRGVRSVALITGEEKIVPPRPQYFVCTVEAMPLSREVEFLAVDAIAELIRRQRGGAAVVMGSLSPRTRNAQVALYQSGEVDFLVATDAIGMGLNMDVDHVAFAGLRKFDGKRTRWLYPQEIGQIAGRAGRYQRDGTFGVTGEAEDMDEDLVQAVEAHRFEPVLGAEWRSSRLDFGSLPSLLKSLARQPDREGLKLAA